MANVRAIYLFFIAKQQIEIVLMAFSFRILLSPFSFRHSYVCSLSFEAIKLCYSNTIFVLSIKQFNDWNQFFVRTVWHIQYTNIESKAAINDSKVNWWLVTTSFDISDNCRILLVNWTLCLCSNFIHRSRMWSDFFSWKISIVLSVSNFVVLCYARRLVLLFSDFYQYNANGLCQESLAAFNFPLWLH